ncbi:MAG: hypothetical protein ACLQK4_14540 [Acidimicrobiales bacterium]
MRARASRTAPPKVATRPIEGRSGGARRRTSRSGSTTRSSRQGLLPANCSRLCLAAGAGGSLGPAHVHDVMHRSGRPAVSIHAYSPPLTVLTTYEETPFRTEACRRS